MQALIDATTREIKGVGTFNAYAPGELVVELREDQLLQLDQRGQKFYESDGVIVVVVPQWLLDLDAAEAQAKLDRTVVREIVVTTAQTAVGVSLGSLTAAQVRSLLAILLYKAGGVTVEGKIRPLAQWAE